MESKIKFTTKYAPKHLNEVVGQEELVSYLRAVVKNPDAAHPVYVIHGQYGCGKTASVRAFARDLLKVNDLNSTNRYLEIDSGDTSFLSDFDHFKDFIFQETAGYKIVVLDEFHLLPKELQGKLLKDLDDFTGRIFFFIISTELEGILPTIISRAIMFHVYTFSNKVLKEVAQRIVNNEGLSISNSTIDLMVYKCFGHMRNLLNQIEVCAYQGEQEYLRLYSNVDQAIVEYFSTNNKAVIDTMITVPYELLKQMIDRYFTEVIIKQGKIFHQQDLPKVFMPWLRLKQYVKDDQDFYSMLFVYHDIIANVKRIDQ